MLKNNLHRADDTSICDCVGLAPGQNNQLNHIGLPLKYVDYSISIVDGLADVVTTQTYINNSNKFLEVQYRYPVNPRACLYRFQAHFGSKHFQGFVKEKGLAQKQFSEAVLKGQKAGYGAVSNQSRDIMIVQIGNIAPSQTIKIEIAYVQELSLTLNIFYKFDLPAKLRPRYLNSLSKPDYFNSFRKKYKTFAREFQWDFKLKLISHRKVVKYDSFTHPLRIEQDNNSHQHQLLLTLEEGNTLLKDFSFIYTTEQFEIPTCVLGRTDCSTTAMVSFIPKFCHLNVEDAYLAAMNEQELEINMDSVKGQYIFLLDRSGSMDGSRIKDAKRALILFIKSLPVDTYFNVISFGSSFEELFQKSVRNEKSKVDFAIKAVSKFEADLGGTEIQTPLRLILKRPVIEGYPRQIFLLTDGAVYDTRRTINLVGKNIKYSRVHTIGIGDGASEALIKGCAQKGKGYHIFIKDQENSAEKIIQLLNDSLTPVLAGVKLEYDKNLVECIVPNPQSLAYVLKGEVVNFYITFKGQLQVPTTIYLKYSQSLNNLQFIGSVDIDPKGQSFPFVAKMGHLRQLFALQESEASGDKAQNHAYFVKDVDIKKEIVEISTKHQILSNFTAFCWVQMEQADGIYQQFQDKGQIRINIATQNKLSQKQSSFSDSDSDDDIIYLDQCAFANYKPEMLAYQHPPPQLEMQYYEYQSPLTIKKKAPNPHFQHLEEQIIEQVQEPTKQQDKQLSRSLDKIINEQHVQGFWSSPMIVNQLLGAGTIPESAPLDQKDVIITLLIVGWLQLHHPSKQYTLIIKKAKAWLNKQKDIAQIKALYWHLVS